MPAPAHLPQLPTFIPATAPSAGLELLIGQTTPQIDHVQHRAAPPDLHRPGPYNPAAPLPPKVVRRILALEFIEMAELRADIWPDEPGPHEGASQSRRPMGKPPVNDIRVWLECFARMAAVLVTRFPEKGPELWAYQSTILKAAHMYEGSNWVSYDRQFRRDMLVRPQYSPL